MKILMVLTSHDALGCTGQKTGFWLEEFAAPYYIFKDARANIVLASPLGGQPPLDPKSDEPSAQTDATRRFKTDKDAQSALATTIKLVDVQVSDFDAVFYPGGHGPLWDLAEKSPAFPTRKNWRWVYPRLFHSRLKTCSTSKVASIPRWQIGSLMWSPTDC
jgi:putative intracellular protease/amidase